MNETVSKKLCAHRNSLRGLKLLSQRSFLQQDCILKQAKHQGMDPGF